jgi:outer membrane protein TolC
MPAPLRLRWYTVATAVLFVLVAPAAAAQPVALLPAELSMLVAAAIDTHPSIKRARANRRAALQDIDAAHRAKWPTSIQGLRS